MRPGTLILWFALPSLLSSLSLSPWINIVLVLVHYWSSKLIHTPYIRIARNAWWITNNIPIPNEPIFNRCISRSASDSPNPALIHTEITWPTMTHSSTHSQLPITVSSEMTRNLIISAPHRPTTQRLCQNCLVGVSIRAGGGCSGSKEHPKISCSSQADTFRLAVMDA